MKNEFTEDYFFKEIISFRMLMGSKDFWNKPEISHEGALKGLTYCWLHSENSEKNSTIFYSIINEYEMRSKYYVN